MASEHYRVNGWQLTKPTLCNSTKNGGYYVTELFSGQKAVVAESTKGELWQLALFAPHEEKLYVLNLFGWRADLPQKRDLYQLVIENFIIGGRMSHFSH